jgi:hypothetical protein
VKVYQLISRVYVKDLHERTKDMSAAMCTCITHMHARAFCVLRIIFVLCFLLVNSTTPRLSRQPRLVARREVLGGGF